MNEATFEAILFTVLTKTFPFIKRDEFECQRSFTLKFGHSDILVNGTIKNNVRGISDVLIKYNGKSLAIFELKAPENELTAEDARQGISYARLTQPMTPLVILTNGEDTRFFTTYDGEQWIADSIDADLLQEKISCAAACAKNAHDEAIKILLAKQPELLKKVFTDYTKRKLAENEGSITDLSYTIAKGFKIDRPVVVRSIEKHVVEHPLVNFVGDPLFGKTNAVFQFCNTCNENIVPLYVDASNQYGIFKQMANIFVDNLYAPVDPTDVKTWLISTFRSKTDIRISIIVDNIYTYDENSDLWKDIFEITDINTTNSFSVLLVMNENILLKKGNYPGRKGKNRIGKAPTIKLQPLSDAEFELAVKYLYENSDISLQAGSQHNDDYRNPRILRLLTAEIINDCSSKSTGGLKVSVPSITTENLLSMAWSQLSDYHLQKCFRELAKCFIEESGIRKRDTHINIMSFGRGIVSFQAAKSAIGETGISELQAQGFIRQFNSPGGKAYILPKFPEALAVAAAYLIKDEIQEFFSQGDYTEAYEHLISAAVYFPYNELVATMAIMLAGKDNDQIIASFISKLIKDKPRVERIEGKNAVSYIENVGFIEFGKSVFSAMDEHDGLTNCFPWRVLSYIATNQMVDENNSNNIHLDIIYELGSFEQPLIESSSLILKSLNPYRTHYVTEKTYVVCPNEGIIEPITYAIQCCMLNMPREMLELCKRANKEHNAYLLARLYVAARQIVGCSDAAANENAEEIIRLSTDFGIDKTCGETCNQGT